MDLTFFKCEICHNLVVMINNSGNPMRCCGKEMTKLSVNENYGSPEHHIPIIKTDHDKVKVKISSEPHPMETGHYISWICLQTKKGFQLKHLVPGNQAELCFIVSKDDEPEKVYCYCNIHGLWMECCDNCEDCSDSNDGIDSKDCSNSKDCRDPKDCKK